MKTPNSFITKITDKNETTKALTLTFAIVGVIYIIVSSVSVLLGLFGIGALAQDNSNICYDFKTLNETLNDIDKNCGSTQITKEYGSDDWSVFISGYNNCNGKTCEAEYIPLNECVLSEVSD